MTPAELAAVAWGMATCEENPMPVDVACEWLTDRADCDWGAAVKMLAGCMADELLVYGNELGFNGVVSDMTHTGRATLGVRNLDFETAEREIAWMFDEKVKPADDFMLFGHRVKVFVATLRLLVPAEVPS